MSSPKLMSSKLIPHHPLFFCATKLLQKQRHCGSGSAVELALCPDRCSDNIPNKTRLFVLR